MRYFLSENFQKNLASKQLLLDNDFLSFVFSKEEIFTELPNIFSHSSLIIDPLTEFEFLRDIYLPAERVLREQFIQSPLFVPAINHQQIFKQIQVNALFLSKLYAHGNNKCKPSTIDLLLAGRAMLYKDNLYLVTGNKKDFPSQVFDIKGIISVDREGFSGIKTYSVLGFNQDKYEKAYEKYNKMSRVA